MISAIMMIILLVFKVSLIDLFLVNMIHVSTISVPVSTQVITAIDTVDAGSALILSCDYTLNPSINLTRLSVTWTINNTELIISEDDGSISSNEDDLIFTSLTTSYTGIYTCILTLTPTQYYVTVQERVQSSEKVITVQSKVCPLLRV